MRNTYEADQQYGYISLVEKHSSRGLLGNLSRGNWIADCYGPSHPKDAEGNVIPDQLIVNTRDIYYGRLVGLSCPACRPYLEAARDEQRRKTLADRAGRPPAPVRGLVIGRLFLDEWIPLQGWLCACLCGCGQYETVRTTQFVWVTALRPCPMSGRVRPASGCGVTYRDGEETVVAYETEAES
jgi:hypothetical protein